MGERLLIDKALPLAHCKRGTNQIFHSFIVRQSAGKLDSKLVSLSRFSSHHTSSRCSAYGLHSWYPSGNHAFYQQEIANFCPDSTALLPKIVVHECEKWTHFIGLAQETSSSNQDVTGVANSFSNGMPLAYFACDMICPITTRQEYRLRQEGFTSLELMVVVAIVGVLAALGVTNFGVWKARADLKSAVTTIQHELAVARMMAMSRNLTVTSTVAVAPTVVTVTTFNTNTGAVLASANHTYTHVNSLFAQLTVGPPPTWGLVPTTNVTFNSMGFRVGGTVAGSLNQVFAIDNDLTPTPLRYTIQVTQRGSVKWCGSDFCQGTH